MSPSIDNDGGKRGFYHPAAVRPDFCARHYGVTAFPMVPNVSRDNFAADAMSRYHYVGEAFKPGIAPIPHPEH